MRNILISFVLILAALPVLGQKQSSEMDRFITALMKKMTLEEKIGQTVLSGGTTQGYNGKPMNREESIKQGLIGATTVAGQYEMAPKLQQIAMEQSRMKIPLLIKDNVIHGFRTIFPIPLAMSCSWDLEGIKNVARISAIEASCEGIGWTFSPMVDICHDARWGRIAEGAGEDPYLGSAIATAMVQGYQENMSSNTDIMACIKHFALYGAVEAGRDYNTVDMSRYRMYNEYFPPYKAAVEAGAGSVMTSFNTVNGIPSTANKWLLTDVLRNQWHFNGFAVTDATAISELRQHGLGDLQQVSAKALKAGVDMDMGSGGFIGTLKKSLSEGKVTEVEINKACRYILEAKYKLGLFANPYKFCNAELANKEEYTKEHLAESRKMASESFVLLKNNNNLLPLHRNGTVAVIGPLAEAQDNMNGTWSVNSNSECSLVNGLRDVAGSNVNILYAKGCNLESDRDKQDRETMGCPIDWDNRSNDDMIYEAVNIAKQSDVVIAALGE